jgi:hypothetical protein
VHGGAHHGAQDVGEAAGRGVLPRPVEEQELGLRTRGEPGGRGGGGVRGWCGGGLEGRRGARATGHTHHMPRRRRRRGAAERPPERKSLGRMRPREVKPSQKMFESSARWPSTGTRLPGSSSARSPRSRCSAVRRSRLMSERYLRGGACVCVCECVGGRRLGRGHGRG